MSSIYHRLGQAFACWQPHAGASEEPQTGTGPLARVIAISVDPPGSEALQPATPDGRDLRAPNSPRAYATMPTVAPNVPQPPARSPKAGADIASGLRFGVEVEHQGLEERQVVKAVRKHVKDGKFNVHHHNIAAGDGRLWHLDEDGGGVELVTPIMQGKRDLRLLQQIVKTLRKAGGQTDERAGLHVHIDGRRFDAEHVEALLVLMSRHEHWLYPVWGVHPSRRTRFCQPIEPAVLAESLSKKHLSARERLRDFAGTQRYVGLNLQNLLKPNGLNTIEFRYLNGTLDGSAIGCAVGFYMALAERALQSKQADAAACTRPSSLPALLRELGIERSHPVAAHLYTLLRERIAAGLRISPNLPMPNIDALLRDENFVEQLCLRLDAADEAVHVVGKVRASMRKTVQEQAQLEQAIATFARDIERCTGIRADARIVRDMVSQYDTRAADILPFLEMLGHAEMSPIDFNRLLKFIGNNMHIKVQLRAAGEVAALMEPESTHARLERLEELAVFPFNDLAILHLTMVKLPKDAARALGQRLLNCMGSGEDMHLINQLLHRDPHGLKHHPHRQLTIALLDISLDDI